MAARRKIKARKLRVTSSPLEILVPSPPPPRKHVVRWDADEWIDLAKRVMRWRRKHPEKPLFQLANDVQGHSGDEEFPLWDQNRKRQLTGLDQVKPLLSVIRNIEEERRVEWGELRRLLESQTEAITHYQKLPTREDLIAQITPEEIQRRFTPVVLQALSPQEIIHSASDVDGLLSLIEPAKLFAHFGKTVFERLELLERQVSDHINNHPSLYKQLENGHTNGNGQKAKPSGRKAVALVGFQQHAVELVRSHIGKRAEIVHVEKTDREADCHLPSDVGFCVVAETYTSRIQLAVVKRQFPHAHYMHKGTVTDLIRSLDIIPPFKKK